MKGIFLIFIFIFSSLAYITFAQSTCDYKVEILLDGEEFKSKEFTWRMRATKVEGGSTNITGTAEIKDSNDKIVKTYKPWTKASISKQKTSNEYTPNLKPGKYTITAEISVECDDTNKDNNIDVKTVKITDEEETKEDSEDMEIKKEAQNEEQTQTSSNTKNVVTKPKKPTIAEETDNAIELKSKNNQKSQEVQTTAAVIQAPQNVYISSNEKAKELILIFLLTLSILLNIILIWRR